MGRGAKKGEHRSPSTEIKPGQHLSSATEFRPGQIPANYNGKVGLPRSHPDYHRRWREQNRDRWNKQSKKYQDKLREEVFSHYGWRCKCCGEDTPEFLTIDHIDGGGGAHRKTFKGPIYRILRKLNFPSGYQTLCWNCNAAKSIKGGCPHQRFKLVALANSTG